MQIKVGVTVVFVTFMVSLVRLRGFSPTAYIGHILVSDIQTIEIMIAYIALNIQMAVIMLLIHILLVHLKEK